MELSREAIQRMVQGQTNIGIGGGGGGSSVDQILNILQDYPTLEYLETTLENYVTTTALETTLADYATKSYVDQNYLSLSFFNALFQARTSQGAAVAPNSGDITTIDNIKAMFGFWTDQYISALGQGSDGGGATTTLAQLNDVQLSLPLVDGEVLTYSSALGKWTNGAGVSADWANITGKPTTIAGYGITDAYISNGTITLGANSITPITSLTGYATESWVNTQLGSYVTTTALGTTLADYVTTTALATTLADYATKTYVDQNYLSLAFFNALFQARTSGGVAVAPNSGDTTTIDNIKALFGFWTDQYISALGQGSDGGAVTSLAALTDVSLSTPLADGEVLTYSTTLGKWTNGTAGVDMTTVWSALAGNTNEQINASHLTTALSGYATTSALANYLPLSGGTINANNTKAPLILKGGIGGYREGLRIIPYGDWADILLAGSDANEDSGTSANSWFIGNHGGDLYITRNGSTSGDAILSCINNIWFINGYYALHSGNSSVSKSGETLTVKISNTSHSLTNTWRGIQNNLTSSSTTDSLSAYQGYLLANGSARDNTKLPLTGGTLNGNLTMNGEIDLQRVADENYGRISFYSSDYYVWYLYMSPTLSYRPNNSACPTGGTVPTGTYVTGWGLHSLIENVSGYGWTWESCANSSGANPSIMMELSSETGNLKVYGTATIANTITCSRNSTGEASVYATNSNGSVRLVSATSRGVFCDTASNWLVATDNTNTWLSIGNVGIGTTSPYYKLHVNGTFRANGTSSFGDNSTINGTLSINAPSGNYAQGIRIHEGSDHWAVLMLCGSDGTGDGGTSSNTWGIFNNNGTFYINRNAASTANAYTICNKSGNWGIATTSPSYKLHVAGDIYATGGVTALSDIRHKTIVEDTRLQVSDIARMRAVRYIWNDGREDNGIHVGSIAQDWQQILPEVVLRANNDEGTLSLQYGVAALISSITIARKVVNHEERIKALERENADLKQAYSFIKNAYDYLKMDYEQLKLKIA